MESGPAALLPRTSMEGRAASLLRSTALAVVSALLIDCTATRPEIAQQHTLPARKLEAGGAVLVVVGDSGHTLAVDRSHVYWLDRQSLARFAKDGGKVERLRIDGGAPAGLTQDAEHVYFTVRKGGSADLFSVAKRDLSSVKLSQIPAKVRRLDNDDTHVYWTAYGDAVGRVVKGSGTLEIVVRGQRDSESIHVDERFLYWTNTGPRGADNSMDLMVQRKLNGNATYLFDDCSVQVGDRDALYCAGRDVIWRVNKHDGRVTRLTPRLPDRPYALALSVHRVYWSTLGTDGARRINNKLVGSDGGTVMSVAKTGGQLVDVARDLTEPYVLATDAESLWWRDARGLHRVPLEEAGALLLRIPGWTSPAALVTIR